MQKKFFFVLAMLLLCQAQAAIYISPKGNDKAQGTKKAPLKSLSMAIKKASKQSDKKIILLDGFYELKKTITFTPKHSGIKIKAAHEGKAIISGSYSFTPKWKTYKNNILVCDLPKKLDLNKGGFDQMSIAEQMQRLARYPNYDVKGRFFGGTSADSLSANRIRSWKNPTGGFVHSLHGKEWGGDHWRITGKKSDTQLNLEGGWMNNRPTGMHHSRRFVENIFEELDAPGEWFLDRQQRKIYFYPTKNLKLKNKKIVLSRLETLLHFKGTIKKPVKDIKINGIVFKNTTRTFMKTKEALLRSDWRIFRGGALFFEGAKNCKISNCTLTDLGGNALFVSSYNEKLKFTRNHIYKIGANAVAFVGLPSSVWNPMFDPYGRPTSWDKINKKDKGPKTEDYPRQCIVDNSLIHDVGQLEKQAAPIQISMSYAITIRRSSLYDCPRAGINIGENAFGGHLIEYCDVFNTVLETGDHGSFNSWGRDRYWHLNYGGVAREVAKNPELPKLDMLAPNTIRNSRWRCDHGWDIDLDDGSSWYNIYNNLCLKGGIKLREGYYRTVENNIMFTNTFHPHVWFYNCDDVFKKNIVFADYAHIQLSGWGKEVDYNFFPNEKSLKAAQARKTDKHSVYGSIEFRNPSKLDFRIKKNSKLLKLGFKPFPMDKFGVQKKSLKAIAKVPPMNVFDAKKAAKIDATVRDFLGAKVKNLTTMGELSATGMDGIRGIFLTDVKGGTKAYNGGLRTRDVIVKVNGVRVDRYKQLQKEWKKAKGSVEITIVRLQHEHHKRIQK